MQSHHKTVARDVHSSASKQITNKLIHRVAIHRDTPSRGSQAAFQEYRGGRAEWRRDE